jgi:N-acetylglucosaminyl-diphospho-decaprenol L-rhamnosyltransferase
MNMHVAVLIVGYRNADDISQCVTSLAKSTYRDFEIVICENGGDAAFAALQSTIPATLPGGQGVKLVKAPSNGGYASGINIAMSESRGADAWWILNPDTEPSPGAMAALMTHLLRGYDAVGGPILYSWGEVQSFGGVWLAWRAKAVLIGHGSPKGTKPNVDSIELKQNFLLGASMFVSRKFVDTIGPMAEHYFLYCEEVEWCLRGVKHGMRLGFSPDAVVVHHQGTTTGYSRSLRSRSCHAVYLDERNKMLLTWELYPARLPVVAALALYRLVGRYGRDGAFRQVAYGAFGLLMGVCGQSGIPRWARNNANI